MRWAVVLALLAALAVGCNSADHGGTPLRAEPSTTTSESASTASIQPSRPPVKPAPASRSAQPTRSPAKSARPTATAWTVPSYSLTVSTISRQRLPYSWRPGCPVTPENLRLLTLRYWGFDHTTHRGELVVQARYADAIGGVFRSLYDRRFPIARMQLVDVYGGDDDRSTRANNTSAFNCRAPYGSSSGWSQHAYGAAVDINPVQNPYVYADGHVLDPNARPYLERSVPRPGMILAGDPTVGSFAANGWGWGGYWSSVKDYQHFSANGR